LVAIVVVRTITVEIKLSLLRNPASLMRPERPEDSRQSMMLSKHQSSSPRLLSVAPSIAVQRCTPERNPRFAQLPRSKLGLTGSSHSKQNGYRGGASAGANDEARMHSVLWGCSAKDNRLCRSEAGKKDQGEGW
jgi:hypothetical protein